MNRHWMAIGAGVQSSAQGEGATVDALVSKYAQLGQFNGTVLVAREGRVLLEKGFGMASFENSVSNLKLDPKNRNAVQMLQKITADCPSGQSPRFVLESLCTL